MREIKFRGIDFQNRALFRVGTYYFGVMYPSSFQGHFIGDYLVDENTIGQFTGLLDKNGLDIYEGDIVKSKFDTSVVVFTNGAFYRKHPTDEAYGLLGGSNNPFDSDNKISGYKIIGNIYTSPELLNIEKK